MQGWGSVILISAAVPHACGIWCNYATNHNAQTSPGFNEKKQTKTNILCHTAFTEACKSSCKQPNWLLWICAAVVATGVGSMAARESMQAGVQCDVSLAGPPGEFLRQRPLHSSRLITHFNELNY